MKFNLNSKNLPFLLRAVFCIVVLGIYGVFCGAEIFFWHIPFYVPLIRFTITAAALGITLFYASNLLFLSLGAICAAMTVMDTHLISLYNYDFKNIGQQIFLTTRDTNIYEIFGYLPLISYKELTVAAVFLILFVLALKFPYKPQKRISKAKAALLLIIFFLFGYPHNFTEPLMKYREQISANQEVIAQYDAFKFQAQAGENSPKNVIIIIGESHREDYFSKYFKEYENEFKPLISFSDMISLYPNTNPSLPLILTRRPFGDTKTYFREKSLFSLFREAGYETYYINYLNPNHKGDSRTNMLVKEAGKYIKFQRDKNTPLDEKNDIVFTNYRRYLQDAPDDKYILPILKDILSNDKRNFIVAKLIGVHFNPQDRYPDSWDKKQPSLKRETLAPTKENAQVFLNTYENAMAYNTSIIAEMMRLAKNAYGATLFVFLSDHGFCLFESGGYNTGNCPKGFHIPTLIYANESYFKDGENQEKFNKVARFENYPLTQRYIFETVVSLSDISYPTADGLMDLTKINPELTKDRPREVEYINGEHHDYDKAKLEDYSII